MNSHYSNKYLKNSTIIATRERDKEINLQMETSPTNLKGKIINFSTVKMKNGTINNMNNTNNYNSNIIKNNHVGITSNIHGKSFINTPSRMYFHDRTIRNELLKKTNNDNEIEDKISDNFTSNNKTPTPKRNVIENTNSGLNFSLNLSNSMIDKKSYQTPKLNNKIQITDISKNEEFINISNKTTTTISAVSYRSNSSNIGSRKIISSDNEKNWKTSKNDDSTYQSNSSTIFSKSMLNKSNNAVTDEKEKESEPRVISPYSFTNSANKKTSSDKLTDDVSVSTQNGHSRKISLNVSETTTEEIYNKFPVPDAESNSMSSSSIIVASSISINLEDLMILEEKLFQILENFRASKPSSRNCYEWWSFYNYCLLAGKFEYHFKEDSQKKIVRDSCALEFISIIISFEASIDTKVLTTTVNILKNLLYLIHQNFLIICDFILSKVSSESLSNVWLNKIQNLILSKMNKRLKKGENVTILKQNNENIFSSLKNIFRIYAPSTNTSNKQLQIDFMTIIYFVKNLSKVTIASLNEYFRNKVLKVFNKNDLNFPPSLIVEAGDSLPSISVPYLSKKFSKNFTLVLDLDETLVHFRNTENGKGLLRLRPGLNDFLDILHKIYEIVIFTAATKEYADPILNAIDKEGKYFDYRLYRQHAIIIENDFVKDLSKLGRDLSKTLIIDNMPQNFKLQKENGIYIKTFYGEDAEDSALIDLVPILIKITKNSDASTDLRKEIKKYKNAIFKKITTNLDRLSKKSKEKNEQND